MTDATTGSDASENICYGAVGQPSVAVRSSIVINWPKDLSPQFPFWNEPALFKIGFHKS